MNEKVKSNVSKEGKQTIQKQQSTRVNKDIRAPKVRLIGIDGRQIGIMDNAEALKRAAEEEMDLVEVSPTANPPVCKIMDFGKYKYELSKKEKDSKKKQHVIHVKEIRLRPKTERHDFEFKVRNARKFIEQGNKVKFTIMFRGRELEHLEFGEHVIDEISEELSDLAKIEMGPKREGRNLSVVFSRK